jgi:Ca-activated chloride channel family protein
VPAQQLHLATQDPSSGDIGVDRRPGEHGQLRPGRFPTGGGAPNPSLNLALVLDVSGSMYEEDGTGISRLARIQQAAYSAVQKLKPEDHLSIVAFAHDCQVVLPSTPLTEKEKIDEVISRIDRFDVDPGGTSMDSGIEKGLVEVEKHHGSTCLSQLVVLTDGETSGEQTCRDLARSAAQKKIHFNVIGVGTEWNPRSSGTSPSW